MGQGLVFLCTCGDDVEGFHLGGSVATLIHGRHTLAPEGHQEVLLLQEGGRVPRARHAVAVHGLLPAPRARVEHKEVPEGRVLAAALVLLRLPAVHHYASTPDRRRRVTPTRVWLRSQEGKGGSARRRRRRRRGGSSEFARGRVVVGGCDRCRKCLCQRLGLLRQLRELPLGGRGRDAGAGALCLRAGDVGGCSVRLTSKFPHKG